MLIITTAILLAIAFLDKLLPAYKENSLIRSNIRHMVLAVLPILVAVLILRSFVVEPFRIPSSSMEPSLLAGDYILVNKYHYGLRIPLTNYYLYKVGDPQRGDVVVFFPPNDDRYFIKRVVGLPGDLITYRNKRLSVNGEPVRYADRPSLAPSKEQPFVITNEELNGDWHTVQHHENGLRQDFDLRIRRGHYFVMGDNRDNSRDSRVWGQVPRERFIGRAIFIWMHWRTFGSLPDFGRFGVIE